MKIAFLGSRGIPARYSGFETFYEQLAVRLAQRGHQVTVYNRSHFIRDVKGAYKGVRLISSLHSHQASRHHYSYGAVFPACVNPAL